MRLFQILVWIIVCGEFVHAQKDSVLIDRALNSDGIYLSYDDFRRNNIIGKERLLSDINKDQQEFVTKLLDGEKFSFINSDSLRVDMETLAPFAYRQNNTYYLNYNGDFYRVPVFGTISYFVATVVVVNPGFYDPRFGYGSTSTRTRELREFVMDYYTGEVLEFRMEQVKSMLSRDKTIYAEFKKLSRRRQKEQVYRFIRKYNERHPVYFLK